MSAQRVDVTRTNGIVTCTLSNPPSHTLTAQGVYALLEQLDELERDEELRVLVLTGGGEGVFVAHYEVGELADAAEHNVELRAPASAQAAVSKLHGMHQLCLRLERLPAITIAAINGNAAGGGFELALACDFRLMADGHYRVGLPETSVGIIPGSGGTQRFARLLGTARALDLILHAKLLTPADALELGLLHRLFPEASFQKEVEAFAQDLAGRAPIAMAAAKRAIHEGSQVAIEDGLAIEQACLEQTMRSSDAAGALRAVLKGKPFSWQGQ